MFGLSKKIKKEKEIREKFLKEIETNYPIGLSIYYMGEPVVVTDHHSKIYDFSQGKYIYDPGIYVQWWTLNKELHTAFITPNRFGLIRK